MNIQIHADLVDLNRLFSGLNFNNFNATFYEIINKIGLKLKELDFNAQKGFSPLTNILRQDALLFLKKWHGILNSHSPADEKVRLVTAQILGVAENLEQAPVGEDKIIIKPKIGLKIGFFCDIDLCDRNAAVTDVMKLSIQQNLPFITTRSLLEGRVLKEELYFDERRELEHLLLVSQSQWDIYRQQHPDYGEEFLVFLPKSLASDKEGLEKLNALDFASDGTLCPISFKEIFHKAQQKNDLRAFFNLFSPSPQLNKLFYIDGHGDQNHVAGLHGEHYKQFLKFIEFQRCCGLGITSCYSGGKSSLLSLPTQAPPLDMFDEQNQKTHSFPIIVRSIGDFATYRQRAEENLRAFYDNFASFVESPHSSSLSHLRKFMKKAEQNLPKTFFNLNKVYFPHPKGSPGGFRPLGEGNKAYSLTLIAVRRAILMEGKGILIRKKHYVLVHPLIVHASLFFKKTSPLLVSMIPGQGHHFLKSIHLAALSNPKEYLFNIMMVKFHKEGMEMSKGFFIGSISSDEGEELNEIVIHLTTKGSRCAFREGDDYYLSDGINLEPITPLQHVLFFLEVERDTAPEDAAVWAVSANQETDQIFKEIVRSDSFWTSKITEARKFVIHFEEKTKEEILAVPQTLNLNSKEIESFVFFLFNKSFDQEAFAIIQREKIDPNCRDFYNIALIFYAIQKNHFDLFNYLIKSKVKLKTTHPKNHNTPLHEAVLMKNRRMARRILGKKVKLEAKNKQKKTPIFYAVGQPKMLNLLVQKGANIDSLTDKGYTLLSLFAALGKPKAVPLLLQNKADPNRGKPSALIQAIQRQDLSLVKCLLEAGGKPFEKEETGLVPFVQAILRSSSEIVQLLIEREECRWDVADGYGVTPLIAALFADNSEVVELLQKASHPFPLNMKGKSRKIFEHVLERFDKLGQTEKIMEILHWNQGKSSQVDEIICGYLLKNNLPFLEECIQRGEIDPSTPMLQERGFKAAISSGNPLAVQRLLEQKILIPPNSLIIKDILSLGYTGGGLKMLKLMLELFESHPALANKEKLRLWDLVCKKNDIETAAFLLSREPPFFIKLNELEASELQSMSLASGKVELLNLMERYSFPIDVEAVMDKELSMLVDQDNSEIIKYLLERGLDKDTFIESETLSSLATQKKAKNIIQLLEKFNIG